MGRSPCCDKVGLKRGPWTCEEDQILISFIQQYGHSNWRALPKQAGLLRCGKSCRLRWINYLRPDIKRGNFTREEEDTIIQLHEMMGNRWSAIAAKLPGRTDNEIKNVWHTHLKKRFNKQNETPKSQGKVTKKQYSDNSISQTASQQSRSSDAFSSLTDVSSVKAKNNMTDAQKFELDETPIIDESFWSSPELCYDEFSMDFVFPEIVEDENIIEAPTSNDFRSSSVYIQNASVNEVDSVDFWLDVLVRAGGGVELPEFCDVFVG
ncbi:hypothetical protein RND81_12G131800 [Saponaria officinalis]|uniref:Uncharacterized protein n=1 Tax=Saponaria officinalis TaxID=3572 RepID=A0AAW1HA09_SAPOF